MKPDIAETCRSWHCSVAIISAVLLLCLGVQLLRSSSFHLSEVGSRGQQLEIPDGHTRDSGIPQRLPLCQEVYTTHVLEVASGNMGNEVQDHHSTEFQSEESDDDLLIISRANMRRRRWTLRGFQLVTMLFCFLFPCVVMAKHLKSIQIPGPPKWYYPTVVLVCFQLGIAEQIVLYSLGLEPVGRERMLEQPNDKVDRAADSND